MPSWSIILFDQIWNDYDMDWSLAFKRFWESLWRHARV